MFRFDDTIWRKVFAFLTTVAVAVFIIFVVIYTYDATPYENIHILDDNWDIEVNGEKYYDVTLTNFIFTDQKRGDDISFTTTMPEIICSQPYMQLRVWNSSIEVRLDNDVLYTFGKETMGQGGVVGGGSRWFSLPDDFSGKKLTIDLEVIENNSFTKFYTPMLETSSDMILDFIRQNSFMAVTGIFLAVLGVVLLLFSVYTLFFNRDILQLLWIALLSLAVGTWVLCRYGILQLISTHTAFNYYLEYLSLYVSIPLGMLSIYSIQDKRWKISGFFKLLIIANLLFIPIILAFHLSGVIYVAEALTVSHGLILVDSICVIYLCIKRRHIKTEQTKLIGVILLTTLCVADLVAFQLENGAHKGLIEARYSFAAIGAVVFILVLLINYGLTSAHNFYLQAETTALQKLAYADQLTGLANRTYTNELMIKYDVSELSTYGMVLFDLNDLKKTNDVCGHSAGDKLICKFSEILKNCFEEIGTPARIGGDEFIVLLENPDPEEIDQAILTMKKKIQAYNESQNIIKISAAWGIAYHWEVPDCDTDQLYKLVDARMYDMKRRMKELAV